MNDYSVLQSFPQSIMKGMDDEILALIEELKAKKAEEDSQEDDYDPFGDES